MKESTKNDKMAWDLHLIKNMADKCSLQMNREYFQTVNKTLNRSVEMGVKHVFSSITAHISVISLGTVICAISDTSS